MRDGYVEDFIEDNLSDINQLDSENQKKINEICEKNLNINIDFNKNFIKLQNIQEDIKNEIKRKSDDNINIKNKILKRYLLFAQKNILLQMIDKSWKEHLLSLDHLRQGILRAYGQKDPLNEYKQEAFIMFEEMMSQIRFNITKIISFR